MGDIAGVIISSSNYYCTVDNNHLEKYWEESHEKASEVKKKFMLIFEWAMHEISTAHKN